MRLALDKPSEADAVDASMYEKATGLRARLIVSGSHCSNEEVSGQSAEVKPKTQASHLRTLTSNA